MMHLPEFMLVTQEEQTQAYSSRFEIIINNP